MEVILTEDIPKLGKIGDVVKVKEGFGRNYLLPQKKAILSNSNNMKAFEAQKRMIEARAAKALSSAEAVASRLETLMVTIEKEAGAEDRLFGSVTNKEIAEELAKQGVPIDRHTIVMESPLKTVGDHEVQVKLFKDIKATLKVTVVPKSKA